MKYRSYAGLFPALVMGLCPIPGAFAQLYAPQPMRLQITASRTTIPPGAQATLTVSFLDRNYRKTSNDARRLIQVQPRTTGIVNVRPSIEAMPGQTGVSVPFTGLRGGRVLIQVSSNGLEQASLLVTIANAPSSGGSILPRAWAAGIPRAQIVITGVNQVPANGKSLYPFAVALDQLSASETRVRIDSTPPCVLLYSGPNTRLAGGSLIVVIPAGEQASSNIQAQTTRPGNVTITAQVLPAGTPAQTTLTFDDPRPSSLAFDDNPTTIPVGAQNIPLLLQVADQDNIPLSRLSGTWKVFVRPLDNSGAIHLDPNPLVLSAQVPQNYTLVSVTGHLAAEQIQLFATTVGESLRPAQKSLGFQSSVSRLSVIVPTEVVRNARVPVTVLFLKKDRDQEAATEFSRSVTFHADGGTFDPGSVTVDSGRTEAASQFVGLQSGQRSRIWISTPGVDVLSTQLLIVAAFWQLVLVALGGGVIGGLARFFYYAGQSWDLMPRKAGTSWNPGLVGNAAFCGVFGVVALLMAEYALHVVGAEQRLAMTDILLHTSQGAFLQGIAGGFVGVGILEMLAERLGLADALERRAAQTPRKVAHVARLRHLSN